MVETVTEIVDSCCGCPPETGCTGTLCPHHPHEITRTVYYCDACGKEVDSADDLHRAPKQSEEAWVCEDCLEQAEAEETNECCASCGISHVPLYTELDGKRRCADCSGKFMI